MDLDFARSLIKAAQAHAETLGIRVASAVVDEGGNLVAFERMNGTQLASSQIASGTALAWQRPSGALWSIAQPGAGGFGINTIDPRFVLSAGGLPVVQRDKLVGALGVSGGSGEQDEACAGAALKAPA